MGKKLLTTPRSKIRAMIRQLWLRSRERAKVLKEAGYRCNRCDVKQSKAKGKEVALNVHHVDRIDWDGVVDIIIERVLAGELEVLCIPCHNDEHAEERESKKKVGKGIKEGKVVKGGVNKKPASKRPTPPKGQGSS